MFDVSHLQGKRNKNPEATHFINKTKDINKISNESKDIKRKQLFYSPEDDEQLNASVLVCNRE